MGRYTKDAVEAEARRVGFNPDPAPAKPAVKQAAKAVNKAVKAAANKSA